MNPSDKLSPNTRMLFGDSAWPFRGATIDKATPRNAMHLPTKALMMSF
jgi:hypothetical protein